MVRCIQSAGSDIVGVRKPQFLCLLIHCFYKSVNAPIQAYTGSICGVVSGGKHHSACKGVQRNQITFCQSHRRTLYLNSIRIYHKVFVKIFLLQNHQCTDNFGGACHGKALVDIFPVQYPTGGGFHHNISAGGAIFFLIQGIFLQRNRRKCKRLFICFGKGL